MRGAKDEVKQARRAAILQSEPNGVEHIGTSQVDQPNKQHIVNVHCNARKIRDIYLAFHPHKGDKTQGNTIKQAFPIKKKQHCHNKAIKLLI